MIFESLMEAVEANELILIDGGMCHYHLRRDGQLTIREIISTKPGAGSQMLDTLKAVPGALSLLARCPADLPSNKWYRKQGFILASHERTTKGRLLNIWTLELTAN